MRARTYNAGQHLQRQPLQFRPLASRLSPASARRRGGADQGDSGARRVGGDQRHHRPVVVLLTTAWVAIQDAGNTALLIALAATLPRQIDMTLDMHQLTSGMTDLISVWTRIKGVCETSSRRPMPNSLTASVSAAWCSRRARRNTTARRWPTPCNTWSSGADRTGRLARRQWLGQVDAALGAQGPLARTGRPLADTRSPGLRVQCQCRRGQWPVLAGRRRRCG